jgi:hypothetical protein
VEPAIVKCTPDEVEITIDKKGEGADYEEIEDKFSDAG